MYWNRPTEFIVATFNSPGRIIFTRRLTDLFLQTAPRPWPNLRNITLSLSFVAMVSMGFINISHYSVWLWIIIYHYVCRRSSLHREKELETNLVIF